MWRKCVGAWAAMALLSIGVAQAAEVLVHYDFGPDHDNPTAAAAVWASNLTPTDITAPGNIPVTIDDPSWVSNIIINPRGGNMFFFSEFGFAPALEDAYTDDIYFTWTLTADPGFMLNLESLEFYVGKATNSSAYTA